VVRIEVAIPGRRGAAYLLIWWSLLRDGTTAYRTTPRIIGVV
jgi:hypothetical protein